jgi:hypothetical protein
MAVEPASLALVPDPLQWPKLLGTRTGPRTDRFREQMGLPAGPLILAGHQAEFWHPGILAKWLAAGSAARALGASWAWVVVDHDDNDPWQVRYPVRRADGSLGVSTWVVDAASPSGGTTGTRPASRDPRLPSAESEPALPCVADGIKAIRRALIAHADAASAAAQVTAATGDMLGPLAAPAATVFSTALSRTDLFADFLARASADPAHLAQTHNAPAADRAGAGVRPLERNATRGWELPLWRLDPGGARHRVFAADLRSTPRDALAPRALLMTALLRLAGSDLFIHGTGGGVYDTITEQWIRAWLGEELAPVAVVSATRTLPFPRHDAPSPRDIDRLRHAAHSSRHNPGLLGDRDAAGRKAALLERIRAEKRSGLRPRDTFQEMHDLLASYRARHAGDLAGLDRDAAAAADRQRESAIIHDRTWAFPLHPRDTLVGLKQEIDAVFNLGG